jgi:23S rRNA pseudouridine1911/1915/1917 synthase
MPAREVKEYPVAGELAGERLDVAAARITGLSRSQVQRLIEGGLVLVDGRRAKAGRRVRCGETLTVTLPEPEPAVAVPEALPLEVVYEDGDLLVVNKPRGMAVHPGAGRNRGTLVNALLHHCRDLSGIGGVLRPGIVHRLDKDTSGLLVVAKNDVAHQELARQIKARTVTRRYLALVHGNLTRDRGTVAAPIARHAVHRQKMAVDPARGRPAVTHFRVLRRYGAYTLVELRLETGRTHQIRVHMAHIGHPVVGDRRYGPRRPDLGLEGQFLHAAVLGFRHPRTGAYLEFSAPLPRELAAVLERLESGSVPAAELQEQGREPGGH